MASYTVKSGDTLSGIGARLGVDWRTISGYRSGNPNLIYPGEVLTYGGGNSNQAKAPQATSQPAQPKPSVWQTRQDSLFKDLGNFDKNAQNPIDIYNKALEQLGISDARTRVSSLRQALIDNQNLLDNLAGNISGRTADSLVTESQRQRLYAQEAEPIITMGNRMNQQFEAAQGDYNQILSEGKTQADYTIEGQSARRSALLERLKIAIDRTDNEEKKRQWQAEYDRQVAKDKQQQSNWEKEFALKQAAAARSGGGGGGGRRSSGGGGGSSVDPMGEFMGYIKNQFKASGANPSRQTQDAWANAWFRDKGLSNQARQVYWDAFNKTYGRPANPYDDWLYQR